MLRKLNIFVVFIHELTQVSQKTNENNYSMCYSPTATYILFANSLYNEINNVFIHICYCYRNFVFFYIILEIIGILYTYILDIPINKN